MSEKLESTPAPVESTAGDTEMTEVQDAAGDAGENGAGDVANELPFADDSVTEQRTSFMSYLMSPIVTLLVGNDGNEAILTAHQGLLIKSPYLKEACAAFTEDGSPRQIDLAEEDADTIGSFLEYLYTGDYFPKKLVGQRTLEEDASLPLVDDEGRSCCGTRGSGDVQDPLRGLDGQGEIAYARYVYGHTTPEDATIRAPIANFWATRSHTLRSEAEQEFKALCMEFPQFGYDVLTRVLDEKLKRERSEKLHPQSGSARKRQRQSLQP
ncbi:unnamed protein product [Parascedosporium putredinis]|uniref:BTB domain-containing protein n=1 Tax=Parascedosporium putredinis TaxID=1442378 RepID=A0A9P1H7Z4_9PEZI|nr:unnamed protein product [Parascedosporium putredinis]CAI8000153.1 unnamed protein product [Parascedosporium putredinis]